MKTYALVLLVCLTIAASTSAHSAPSDPCPAFRSARAPILIQGDEGFALPGNGIVAGSGTPNDPYIICGWDIIPNAMDGIRLEGTTAHVVIRDNLVHDSLVELKLRVQTDDPVDRLIMGGINLHDASHVRVKHNTIIDNTPIVSATVFVPPPDAAGIVDGVDGIVVEFSDDIEITDNHVARNAASGILIRESRGVLVEDNRLDANNRFGGFSGFAANGVTDLVVQENEFVNTHGASAVLVAFSPGALVRNNLIDNPAGNGLAFALLSHGSRAEGNHITGSVNGIGTSHSADLVITGNDISGNTQFGIRSFTHLVNAENNWWGCAEGPGYPGCDAVSNLVDFEPWAIQPMTE